MNVDLKGKTALVTGSTDGIGKQTALELARMRARVLLHGKDAVKGRRVLEEIRNASGNEDLDLFIADLAALGQVRRMSEAVRRKCDRLDVLINNAGIAAKDRRWSEDGFEMTFAVNYLAGFLLTLELLDLIRKSAPSRIIMVSSMVHSSNVNWKNPSGGKSFDGWEAYCQSKLCDILFAYELAEKLKGSGVTVNCLHPGVINTKLLRVNFSGGQPVAEGSKTAVYLATSLELENVTGKYFVDRRETKSAAVTYDPEIRRKLWQLSEELCR